MKRTRRKIITLGTQNSTILENLSGVPEGLKNLVQFTSELHDVTITQLEDFTFQISGSPESVQKATEFLESAIKQAMSAIALGLTDFDLPFTGTLEDFLNDQEPAAPGGSRSSNPQDQEFETIEGEQIPPLTYTESNVSSDEDEYEAEELASLTTSEISLESLASFFGHASFQSTYNDGAAFEKPVLQSTLFFQADSAVSYSQISNRLNTGGSNGKVRLGEDDAEVDGGTSFIPNTPPVAADDEVTVLEGQTFSLYQYLLLNDQDTDVLIIERLEGVDGLNGTIVFNPTARTLTYEAGSYFDFYAAGESYTEFFTYHIIDGRGGEFSAVVTVTVSGVNDAPVAQDDVALIADDTTVVNGNVFADNGNGADSDVDASDTIYVSSVSGGSVGSATNGSSGGLFTINANGTLNFNPNGDFAYLDTGETQDTTVTYTVSDGNGGSDTATVTITVTGVNDGPVAQDDDFATQESTSITGDVFVDNGNGADNDVDVTDSFYVSAVGGSGAGVGNGVTGSNGGLFTINADGSLSFDPNGDFEFLSQGQTLDTTVQYTITDNSGATSTATATVTLTGENDSFTGNADTITVNENVTLSNLHTTLLANDVDIDTNDVLDIIAIDTSATNGTVTFNDSTNSLTYSATNYETLAVGQTATDTLTYTVTDGYGVTQDVTVTFTVNGVNDAPIAQNDAGATDEDSTYSTNILADNGSGADSDIDNGDVLYISGVSGGSVGSATAGTNGGLFTINSDGSMSFDTNGDFESLAVGDTTNTTITYTVNDGNGGTDTATVTITITGVNDAPVGANDTLAIIENEMSANLHTSLLADDTDVDTGDVIDIIGIDTSATTGFVTFNDNANILTYSATNFDYLNEGETATDSFVYIISDGNGGTDNVTVTVTITGANDDPTAQEDLLTTDEDTTTSGNVLVDNGNGADSDADTGDIFNVTGVVGGALDVAQAGSSGGLFTISADGSISFDPNGEFEYLAVGESAETTVYYTITDSHGGEGVGVVTMTVTGANDAPIAQDDALSTDESNIFTGNVLQDNGSGADSDIDTSDVLSVSGVTGGSVGATIAGSSGGLFTIDADGSISFDPNGDFTSLAVGETQDTTVEYTVSDGNGGTNTATVTMTVTGVNDAPVAQDDNLNTTSDAVYSGNVFNDNLNGEDSDPDGSDTLTVTGVTGGSVGVAIAGSHGGLFTINADGSISFDPNGEFDFLASSEFLETTVEYTISDGNGGTDTATVTMAVTGGSLIAEDDGLYGEVAEGGDTLIITAADLLYNDITADILTMSVIAMDADPGQGSFVDNGDGTWTYTSPADSLAFSGIANITYTAQDSAGSTDTATFQIRVFNTITGTSGADVMVAADNSVPHKFWGLAGNDTITGSDERDLLIGGADDDIMYGGAGDDDFIFEGTGNGVDTIDGQGGTDRVIGSASDDTFTVLDFAGIEEIDMGAGTDTLLGTAGDDDFIFGEAQIVDLEQIDGGAGTNTIAGTTGDDSYDLSNVSSITNIDRIDMGAGNDSLIGSLDDDTIYVNSGDNTFDGNDGNDTFIIDSTATGINIIDGGAGYDRILGEAGDTTLTLRNLVSIEFIDLGSGTNVLVADIDNTLDLSSYTLGTDLVGVAYITDNVATETVIGTNQNDTIVMNADLFADTFNGLDGDDTFSFSGAVDGGDIVDGGSGTDQIIGSSGNDTLTLSSITSIESIDFGAGTDTFRASLNGSLDLSAYTVGVDLLNLEYITDNDEAETITATDQADTIVMNADLFADTFNGLDGDDTFSFSGAVDGGDIVDGGSGTDQIIGSSGDDTLTLSSITSIESIDFGAGTDTFRASLNGTLDLSAYTLGVDLIGLEIITDHDGAETITATEQDDTIVMVDDSSADSFSGLGGNDTFTFSGGLDSGDSIDGGDGTDQIIGSNNADTLLLASLTGIESIDFGNGNDGFYVNASMDFTGMVVDMGAGTDYLVAQTGSTMDLSSYTLGVELLNLEYIRDNTGGSETIIGTNQADEIRMQSDSYADSFSGLDGDDTFTFSGLLNRSDSIDGGDGTDQITGSSNNDTLLLSTLTGVESMSFGDGNDWFYINASMDFTGMVVDMGSGTDYLAAQSDETIDLSSYSHGVEFLNLEYITDNTGGSETIIGTNQADVFEIRSDYHADSFSGLDGDDVFRFSGNVNLNDTVDGGDGSDQLIGTSGDDRLQLASLSNIESIDFGDGNDVFLTRAGMTPGGFTIDMGDGTDYMMAQTNNTLDIAGYTLGVDLLGLEYITDNIGAETIIATNQDDEIRIRDDSNTDSFFGLDGDDTFIFSGNIDQNDRIDGGDGYDQLLGSSGNDSLTLVTLLNIEYIDLGAGTDFMRADRNGSLDISAYTLGTDLIGLDYITDNAGSETIRGSNQDDEIRLQDDASTDYFYGMDGDDTFIFSGDIDNNDRIYGGDGTDQLIGSSGDDSLMLRTFDSIEYIDFGAGTDFMRSYSGGSLDLSAYTRGVDLLNLEYIIDNNGTETITGTEQDDEIRINIDINADTFYGLGGDDIFRFSGDLDSEDRIYGGDGTDQIIGSSGADSLTLRIFDSIEYIDLGAGTDFMRVYEGGSLDLSSYTVGVDLIGVEYIIDNADVETITGTNQADEIHMSADTVYGTTTYYYADTFYGLDGDDTFVFSGVLDAGDSVDGGSGTDQILGSGSNDTLVLSSMISIEHIDLGSGTDSIRANVSGSLDLSGYTIGVDLIGVEYIMDNSGTESVTGTNQADEIHMNSDNNADTFYGLDGDDTFVISGSVNGGDIVYGGSGTDQILGSNSNDTLVLSIMDSIEHIDLGNGGNDSIRASQNGTLDLSAYTVGVDLLGVEFIRDNSGTETVTGTNQDDVIFINSDVNSDTFNGLGGDDNFIFSGTVNGGDRIDGGTGTNTVTGSAIDDVLSITYLANVSSIDFGDGDDRFVFSSGVSLVGVVVDMGDGDDGIRARSGSSIDLSAYTLGVDILNLEYIMDGTSTETVTGTSQNDEIRLTADTYADTFNGGGGDDVFVVSGSVNGGDRLDGGTGTNTVIGSDGNDVLNVTLLDNISSIDFGGGNDAFLFSSGVDLTGVVIDMGAGTDYMRARSSDSLDLSAYTLGVDILNLEYITDSTGGAETITGTNQADEIRLSADSYADTFYGMGGDDVFVVSGSVNGGDSIDGGTGTNTIVGSSGADTLSISSLANIASIDFGDGNDGFFFSPGVDLTGVVVDMGAGTDYIGARYNSTLDLSAYVLGVDILNLEYIRDNTGIETVTGTDQADEIRMYADIYSDTFNGGGGDDVFVVSGNVIGGDHIDGGTGTNTIVGSSGNDVLMISSIANISSIDFGDGNDGFLFSSGVDLTGVVIDMGAGTDYFRARGGNSLDLSSYTLGVDILNLEYITDNTSGAETITGTNQADEIRLSADGYADTFNGGGGDDVFVVSGAVTGGDRIDGGTGTNTIVGSSGDDTVYLSSITNIDSIDFGSGNDGFTFSSGVDLTGVAVDMGAGTDYIYARSGNTLDLSSYTLGVDILNLEYITDNSGSETIHGTNQDDTIHLQADSSSDVIYGNDGADLVYVIGQLGAVDTLADFDASEGDVLDISDILSYDSANGDLISDFIRLTDTGDGDAANGSGSVTISIDVDGALNGENFQDYFVFNDQGLDLTTLISNGTFVAE